MLEVTHSSTSLGESRIVGEAIKDQRLSVSLSLPHNNVIIASILKCTALYAHKAHKHSRDLQDGLRYTLQISTPQLAQMPQATNIVGEGRIRACSSTHRSALVKRSRL